MTTKQELIAELAHAFTWGAYAKPPEETVEVWAAKLAESLKYTEDCVVRLDATDVLLAYAAAIETMKEVLKEAITYHDRRTNITINI